MENYETVLLTDEKNRITIPAKVREKMNIDEKIVFRLIYKQAENEILLLPIGKSDTK